MFLAGGTLAIYFTSRYLREKMDGQNLRSDFWLNRAFFVRADGFAVE
jgi:hypothetical protein